MSQTIALSRVDLLDALTRLFSDDELQTLCFKLSNVDYESLGGSGKAGKARELVELMERTGRLGELADVVRRERPGLGISYSPERVQELQESILADSRPGVRAAFVELTRQIEAYLAEFNSLNRQLLEWKEVHNLLNDIQVAFGPCRGYIRSLSQLAAGRTFKGQRENLLFEIEVEWRPCKHILLKFQEFASGIREIGEPYQPGSAAGPEWLRQPLSEAAEVDRALFESNVSTLAEHLSAFGDQVDKSLYQADKSLRNVVGKINELRLPRPTLM